MYKNSLQPETLLGFRIKLNFIQIIVCFCIDFNCFPKAAKVVKNECVNHFIISVGFIA